MCGYSRAREDRDGVSCGYSRAREDRDGMTGKFVPGTVNEVLPPVRTYRLQGRIVNPQYLPPTRTAEIQGRVGIDWDQYHFGEKVSRSINRR